MTTPYFSELSRRERQIVDVLYKLGEASVSDVLLHLTDDPSYDTIRLTLGVLEKKGYVQHKKEGSRYIYSPTVSLEEATDGALKHMVKTFFGGSTPQTVMALLGSSQSPISESDLDEMEAWIASERKKKKNSK